MDDPIENADGHTAEAPQGPKLKYKSYKKKYLKIRSRFNVVMNENNGLWEAEQKLLKIAHRLEEELDQVRELLVDVNESSTIPPHLKITIGSSDANENEWLKSNGITGIEDSDIDGINEESAKYSPESAYAVLNEAKKEYELEAITRVDFTNLASSLRPYLKLAKSLAYLEVKVPHTSRKDLDPTMFPEEIVEESPIGYLDANHEAEYLARLDAELEGHSLSDSHPIRGSTLDRPLNAARDNPMSALNWLRKYQPQVFLQDVDGPDDSSGAAHGSKKAGGREEKASKREGTRASKRSKESAAAAAAHKHEELDDEGFVIGGDPAEVSAPVASSGRGSKRKRGNDDDTYHPKAGSGASRRKSKRASMLVDAEMID